MEKEKIETEFFKISGRLARILGKDSIQSANTAILELVKNAWDADATEVAIEFDLDQRLLVVEDNGTGMTREEIRNEWLTVATDTKEREPFTRKFHRPKIGQMGVARFALNRLGDTLEVISKPEGLTEGYRLTIDWRRFTPDIEFERVPIMVRSFPKRKDEHGTRLEIGSLSEEWNHEKLVSLASELEGVLPPLAPVEFQIRLRCRQGPSPEVRFEPSWLKKALYRVEAELHATGTGEYRFYIGRERRPRIQAPIQGPPRACGPVEFTLYFFPRSIEVYKSASKATNGSVPEPDFTEGEIRNFLNQWSGVRIYRDGFRVKPYGDPHNDWIGLTALRVDRPSLRPEAESVIGWIKIGRRQNPGLKDTTTREGLVDNEAFRALLEFARETINFFTYAREEVKEIELQGKRVKKHKRRVGPTPSPPSPRPPDWLEFRTRYGDKYLASLEEEINLCYQQKLPNATLLLVRKLIEDLLYQILRSKFGETKAEMWWDAGAGRPLTLGKLIRNLEASKQEFRTKDEVEKALELLGPFVSRVSKVAHYVTEYVERIEDIDRYRIPELITLLLRMRESLIAH